MTSYMVIDPIVMVVSLFLSQVASLLKVVTGPDSSETAN